MNKIAEVLPSSEFFQISKAHSNLICSKLKKGLFSNFDALFSLSRIKCVINYHYCNNNLIYYTYYKIFSTSVLRALSTLLQIRKEHGIQYHSSEIRAICFKICHEHELHFFFYFQRTACGHMYVNIIYRAARVRVS